MFILIGNVGDKRVGDINEASKFCDTTLVYVNKENFRLLRLKYVITIQNISYRKIMIIDNKCFIDIIKREKRGVIVKLGINIDRLTEEEKDEIRKVVEELLKDVPNGKRIKLNKNILKVLIFYKARVKAPEDDYFDYYYFPIWTGPFLRKLDLSEICFDFYHMDKESYIQKLSKCGVCVDYLRSKNFVTDLSYTNVNINFWGKNIISNCNFEGVDLSNCCLYFENFLEPNWYPPKYMYARDWEDRFSIVLENNNFRNSGIKINTKDGRFLENIVRILRIVSSCREVVNLFHHGNKELKDWLDFYKCYSARLYRAKERLERMIVEGRFDGCYLDGCLIQEGKVIQETPSVKVIEESETLKPDEQKLDVEEKKTEIDNQYKNQILCELKAIIEEQITTFNDELSEAAVKVKK